MLGFVYLIGNDTFGWYKIGKSIHPNIRIKDVGVLLPFTVEVKAVWASQWHGELEAKLHRDFKDRRQGKSEWFAFSQKEVAEIIKSRPEPKVLVTANFTLKKDRVGNKSLIIRLDKESIPKTPLQRISDLINILCKGGLPEKKKRKIFGVLLAQISASVPRTPALPAAHPKRP